MGFKIYEGAGKLYRRTSFAFAITAGMKVQALPMEQRPFKECYQCSGKSCRKCGGAGRVKMRGGVWLNTRLFVKAFRSDRQAGQSITDAVRPLAPEFADINGVTSPDLEVLSGLKRGMIDEDHPPPTGAKVVPVALAGPYPNGKGDIGPAWNQHLRAHKLGSSGFGVKRDPRLEEGNEGVGRDQNPEPNNGPECQGDGKRATRWKNGANGWDHYEIACPDQDCVFAGPGGVCKVTTSVNLITPHGLAQYQSHGSDTGAGALALFGTKDEPGTLLMEAAELGVESLYQFPLRLEISAKTKGKGLVKFGGRTVSMSARRFPVVDITPAMSVVEFAAHQRQQLSGNVEKVSLALPPAPEEMDLIEADHDLIIEEATETTASRPGTEAQPIEEPGDPSTPAAPSRSGEPQGEPARGKGAETSSPPGDDGDPRSLRQRIKEDYVDGAGLDPGLIGKALVRAKLKNPKEALPESSNWEDVKMILDSLVE